MTDEGIVSQVIEWNKERVEAILESSKAMRVQALLHLYDAQSEIEKATQATLGSNGVGFCKFDAELLTSIAQQAKRRGSLSAKQMQVLRNRLPKYWRQLAPLMQPEMAPAVEKQIERADQFDLEFGSW